MANKFKIFYGSCVIFFFVCTNISFAQNGLLKRDLFTLPTQRLIGEGQFNFKIAVDKDETIAIGSCTQPVIFFINSSGKVSDSLKVPFTSCIRNMEFDEYDNLLIMDNEEEHIYKYDRRQKKMEKLPYTKPEDWYTL